MLQKYFPSLMAVLCAGCTSASGLNTSALEDDGGKAASRSSVSAEYARSYMDFKFGAIGDAEAKLRPLLAAADSAKDEPYIRGGLYKRRAEYASGLAWAAIEKGDVKGGRQQFADAVRTLAQDEQQLVNLTHADDEKKQMAGTAVSLGLIGLAAGLDYKNVQAGTYQANSSMLNVLQNSGAIQALSKTVDSTDQLKLFLGEQPRDTDGVRMLVMPALNGPMSLIGRLSWKQADHGFSCTGGLVGPRTVLTAAHCFTEGYRKADPSEVTFTISSPTYSNAAQAVRIITPTEIWREGDFENDWAVVVLDRNPSASQDNLVADDAFDPARRGSKWSPALRQNLYLAGFSSDLNDGRFITLAAKCSFEKVLTPRQAMHHCPSWKGASGSPVLVKHGKAGLDAYHVIGIHSWSRGDKFNPAVVRGMRIVTAEVADAIRQANGG